MTTIIVPLSGYLNAGFTRLWNLTRFAKKRMLTISNHDEVGAGVIALDVKKRKLLYAKKRPCASSCLVIDLSNLERCTIKKEYSNINAGELETKKLHSFLKNIFLQLVFKNSSRTLSLPLFNAQEEPHYDVVQLEAQASKWGTLVSKLLSIPIKEIA